MRLEKASEYIKNGGEDNLSMEALIELLQAVTEKGKSFRMQVHGYSMYPFIRNGDYITISPYESSHPKLGDIVAFFQPRTRKLIVHRIVCKKGDYYLAKGDNVLAPDGFISKTNIGGYVSGVEKNGRTVRLGSRIEKIFIAFMSRKNLLRPTIKITYRLIGPAIRRIKT